MSFSGNDLLSRLADEVPEFTNSGAEQTRALRRLNGSQRKVVAELNALGEDYLLTSATYSLTASTSPNRYSLPTDLFQPRYMERVVSEADADYERIWPVHHIYDKQFSIATWWGEIRFSLSPGEPIGYLLGGDFFDIYPISDDTYTVRFWYTKTLSDIAASATALDLPDALFDPILWDSVVVFRMSLEKPIGEALSMYQTSLDRALANLSARAQDGARTVQYVRDEDGEIYV